MVLNDPNAKAGVPPPEPVPSRIFLGCLSKKLVRQRQTNYCEDSAAPIKIGFCLRRFRDPHQFILGDSVTPIKIDNYLHGFRDLWYGGQGILTDEHQL